MSGKVYITRFLVKFPMTIDAIIEWFIANRGLYVIGMQPSVFFIDYGFLVASFLFAPKLCVFQIHLSLGFLCCRR